jgi:DNA-binding transcriptional LysR family regulator
LSAPLDKCSQRPVSQRLLSGRLVYFLRAAHPRASRKFTMRTFVETPLARVMYPGNERLGSIDTILRSRGLSRRIAVTVPDYLTIPAIVAKSNLLGVVPEPVARREARPLRLKIFEPPLALPDVTVMMTWNERLQFDGAHSWFRDCIADASEKLV